MDTSLLPNVVSFMQQISPFEQLSVDVLEQIAAHAEILYLGSGEQLPEQGPVGGYLYLLRSGVIEQRFPDGRLRSRLGEADVFGFSLQLNQTDVVYHAIALENTLLYRFDYALLLTQLANYPQLAELLARQTHLRLLSSVNVKWSQAEKGLFFKTVDEVASHHVVSVSPQMSIQQVAHRMHIEHHRSCAVVLEGARLVGIVTDRDIAKRVVAVGLDYRQPVAEIMTPAPITIAADALVLTAVGLMMQHRVQALPVTDAAQNVVGLMTAEQLVQKHSVQAVFLIEKISHCENIAELASLAVERQAVFEAMVEGHLSARLIGQVLSLIYDAFTRQLLLFAEQALGPAPCAFCWLAAGSHAREEVHLGSDQDNALVLAADATNADRAYFQHFAMYVCKGLAECGYPICSGRFMAATHKWCQPLSVWQAYYRKWAQNPEYDMLLNLTVFMETRALAGTFALHEELAQYRQQQVTGNIRLMSALVRNALTVRPPLGIFNKLVLNTTGNNEKSLDLKRSALSCLVDVARIYALYDGATMENTEARIQFIGQRQIVNNSAYQDLLGTYRYLADMRYRHHLRSLQRGLPLTNDMAPDLLGSFERQHLKDAFRIISGFQDALKMKFNR